MAKRQTHKAYLFNIRADLLACMFLILATLAVYWQIRNYGFVNFDDDRYVSENHHVQGGIGLKGITWAFSFTHKDDRFHWHPLTWLSHMLDCQLYGSRPGMHHMTNVIFHIASTLLLFLALKRMTGRLWRSAFVAALFGLHPISVDSVAWIAQRKNVLSTFFLMLTIVMYSYYVKGKSAYRYALVFLVFMLGLLSKPMLVTLPFVLLLMDYWPLGRLGFGRSDGTREGYFHLLLEKGPFFVLSGVLICIDSLSQKTYGVVLSTKYLPMKLRVSNALVSYVSYIGKTLWPKDLAVFYPYPKSIPAWEVFGSLLLLILIAVFIFRSQEKRPYLLIGWLWYVGTLVPVIGLMQVGLWPAMADRWAYVPLIGLYIIIAWGIPDLVSRWRYKELGLATIGSVLFSFLMVATWVQAGYWKNSVTLFEHALDVTTSNGIAHYNLGVGLAQQGRTAEAIAHYKEALRLNPDAAEPYNNLGLALFGEGKIAEAIWNYREALRVRPHFAKAHNNLGNALEKQGRTLEAVREYREALRLNSDSVEAHNNLGNALRKQGKMDEAVRHYFNALSIRPDSAETYNNLGLAMAAKGENREAIRYYTKALELNPGSSGAHNNLGNALASEGRTAEAICHYQEALRLNPGFAEAYNNLGAALVRAGKTGDAIDHFRKALLIRPDYAEARHNLERALASQRVIERDILKAKKMLRLNPENAVLHLRLGNLYKTKGELAHAIVEYQRALSVRPGFVPALNNLAVAYADKRQYDEAILTLKKMIRFEPDSADVYYNLACVYARKNDVMASIDWLKKAIDKGYKNWDLIKNDKDLENIRGTSYYRGLMRGR